MSDKKDYFQVKFGTWKSARLKTLKSARELEDECLREISLDKSGNVRFEKVCILKNGKNPETYLQRQSSTKERYPTY